MSHALRLPRNACSHSATRPQTPAQGPDRSHPRASLCAAALVVDGGAPAWNTRGAIEAGARARGRKGIRVRLVSFARTPLELLRGGGRPLLGAGTAVVNSPRGRNTSESRSRRMGTTSSAGNGRADSSPSGSTGFSSDGAIGKRSNSGKASAAGTEASSEQENYLAVTESEWKRRLSKEQFHVTRKKGTERPFTGEYWNTKTPGEYLCICCSMPLFDSKTKFDSGTGWPSYWDPIGDNVKSETDWSIPFMPRTEVLCGRCDAHLGHVFNDGPPPTGKRYCINSASLKLKPGGT